MSTTRKIYDEEFKKNMVRIIYASEKSIKEISNDSKVPAGLLYSWRKKYTPWGEKINDSESKKENFVHRSKLEKLKAERNMLKKAAIYFAKNCNSQQNNY